MGKTKSKITVPTSLYKRIKEKIAVSENKSVEDYIVRVLEEILAAGDAGPETLSKEDEEKVKERLKALGYMD